MRGRPELRVHTARVTYAGADRLDVTRKSAGVEGLPFAPSWRILRPMLRLRAERGPAAFEQAWPRYVEDYTAEMRRSYVEHRRAWRGLLDRQEVTLVCYCADSDRCHRTVLAQILTKLGATYLGERRPARSPPPPRDESGPSAADVEAVGRAVRRRGHPCLVAFAVASGARVTAWVAPGIFDPPRGCAGAEVRAQASSDRSTP